ncbi:MAG TPA: hypothetical protein VN831_29465 [Bradyrhizobium sp.]|nr:hypothetical protein [Bradyrhizobium sp.]
MSRFHDTIKAANGEQLLGGVEDGIPHVRVSRHWIWPSAICTFVQIKWSCQQEAVGWQKPGGVPKSTICKGQSSNLPLMLIRARHIATIIALSLAGGALSECGTINEKLAGGVSDAIPAWAGGLPADAPPRPGTAKYDEFMKERERKRLMPASERGEETKSMPSSQDAVH